MNFYTLKGNVMSLKLDLRLHIHPVGMNTQFGTKAILKDLEGRDGRQMRVDLCWCYRYPYHLL